jgi:hypothetical protein
MDISVEELNNVLESKKEEIEALKCGIAQLTKDIIGLTLMRWIPEGEAVIDLEGFDDCDCEILCSALGLYCLSRHY